MLFPSTQFAGIVLNLLCTAVCIAEDPLDSAGSFESRIHAVKSRLDELIDRSDLAHSLHFGWFDRPYDRATMAIVCKLTSVAEREIALRRSTRGAITDEQLDTMLSWCETATSKTVILPPDANFRPGRIFHDRNLMLTQGTPPTWAFADDTSATRADDDEGDMDLLAAIGQKIYVPGRIHWATQHESEKAKLDGTNGGRTEPREEELSDVPELAVPKPLRLNSQSMSHRELARRAASLGMGFVLSGSLSPEPQSSVNQAKNEAPGYHVLPKTLLELIENPGTNQPADVLEAVSDDVDAESIGGWLARRGLLRGASGRSCHAVINWRPPTGFPADSPQAIRAAMWIAAIGGQQIAVLNGWRDLRDGCIHREPSIFLLPDVLEAEAHTALDMLRLSPTVNELNRRPSVGVVVDTHAIEPGNPNRWASWIVPLFDRLAAMNIRFDVVPISKVNSLEHSGRYANVLTPSPNDVASAASLDEFLATNVSKFEQEELSRAYESDGTDARELYFRQVDSGGHLLFAIVNECDRPREIRVTENKKAKTFHDLLSPATPLPRLEKIQLKPWQVRILIDR